MNACLVHCGYQLYVTLYTRRRTKTAAMILVSRTALNFVMSFSSIGVSPRRLIPAFYTISHDNPPQPQPERTLKSRSSLPYNLNHCSLSTHLPCLFQFFLPPADQDKNQSLWVIGIRECLGERYGAGTADTCRSASDEDNSGHVLGYRR
jgi:hypothetical protein